MTGGVWETYAPYICIFLFSSSAFKPVLLQVTWSMHLILFAKHSNQMKNTSEDSLNGLINKIENLHIVDFISKKKNTL